MPAPAGAGDKGSLWGKMSSWAGKTGTPAETGAGTGVPADAVDDRIHVFTVASGHM